VGGRPVASGKGSAELRTKPSTVTVVIAVVAVVLIVIALWFLTFGGDEATDPDELHLKGPYDDIDVPPPPKPPDEGAPPAPDRRQRYSY